MAILVNNSTTALSSSPNQVTATVALPGASSPASDPTPAPSTTATPAATDGGPPSPQVTAAAQSPQQLKQDLDKALKKTGIKAEIELKDTGIMVVRYMDQDTQQVAFQIPTQTVLDLIASLKDNAISSQAPVSGAIIDQKA